MLCYIELKKRIVTEDKICFSFDNSKCWKWLTFYFKCKRNINPNRDVLTVYRIESNERLICWVKDPSNYFLLFCFIINLLWISIIWQCLKNFLRKHAIYFSVVHFISFFYSFILPSNLLKNLFIAYDIVFRFIFLFLFISWL